jgi:hypothetical protein
MAADWFKGTSRFHQSFYFVNVCDRSFTENETRHINDGVLRAYRWQYVFSGVEQPRFQKLYKELTKVFFPAADVPII